MKQRICNISIIVIGLMIALIMSCNYKSKKAVPSKEKKVNNKTIVAGKWEVFPIGDINNDNIADTSFIYTPAYYGTINPEMPINDNVEFDSCVNGECYNKVRFSNNFPSILIENSLWGSVESIEDLDGDGIKELIFQSNWYIGSHVEIYIYSFDRKKRNWIVLAENNLYGEDGYKDRVVKINNEKFKFKIEYLDTIEYLFMTKEIVVKIRK